MRLLLILTGVLAFPFLAAAQTSRPATLKSSAAREAMAAEDKAIDAADLKHKHAVIEARKQCLATLQVELDKTLAHQDDNEVAVIGRLMQFERSELTHLEAEPEQIFGVTGANGVVYVFDASGSMQPIFDNARNELRQSVMSLLPTQKFNVIFYSGDNVFGYDARGMVPAIARNKQGLSTYIDNVAPKEGSDPRAALRKAIENGPDVIYFITDGFDGDIADTFVRDITALNAEKKIKINCALVSDDAQLKPVLARLATQNGGAFKVVDREALKNRK